MVNRDKPGSKDRVFYRLSEGTSLGDKRRTWLKEVQTCALAEERQLELDSAALLDWAVERAVWGYRLVKEKQEADALLKRMAGALKP